MATTNREYGRRGPTNVPITNTPSSDSGAALSPSSTGSTGTSRRRYVLDIPTSPTTQTNRISTTHVDDQIDETNAQRSSTGTTTTTTTYANMVTTDVNYDNDERLKKKDTNEYFYRDGGVQVSTSGTRYSEDASVKKIIESGVSYLNTATEDEEVQALTAKATPDIKNYPINVDPNPELVVRPNTQRITYTQDIAVRYLKPDTPPPPGPIIIREIRAPPPPPAPPIVLRQRPPPPRTPSPIVIRERPPPRPKSVPTTVIRKIIPPPPPPPRQLIIERLPALPPKPRPVIIERWLPYHKQKRQVIHEKAKPFEPMSHIKNTIIEWRQPDVEVVKHIKKLGVSQADPQQYYNQYGDKLYTTEFVQRKLTELGLQEELALMREQQVAASQEETATEQADEQNVRQILNSYGQLTSGRKTYSTHTLTRLVQSLSPSNIIDGYDDQQQQTHRRSASNSPTAIYETNTYAHDGVLSDASVLTEEMLLRSHASSGGKFPTHLLTKLGSQIYDMPSDQVDLSNNGRRITTTTTTRYYTMKPGDTGYESAIDEIHQGSPRYTEERIFQVKSSDSRDATTNYDVFTSTGEKLDGEHINF